MTVKHTENDRSALVAACPMLFVRHGPTAWNAAKRIQGHTDVPLSDIGRAAVRNWRLPPVFLSWDWISSPLDRARETARLLGPPHCPTDARLMEANFGDWEGQSLPELRATLGDALARNEAKGLDLQVPGGESPRAVRDRLQHFLTDRARLARPTVVVAHAGILRAAYSLASGWDMKSDPPLQRGHDYAHLYDLMTDASLDVRTLNIALAGASIAGTVA